MILRIVIGLMVGVALGALVGRTQSCQTGACPLTANPRRGAIWGGLLGLMFALSLPGTPPTSSGDGKTASARGGGVAAAQSAIVQVGSMEQFKHDVLGRPGKTVVDFYATWCGPCKLYSPILDKLAYEKLPEVNFTKVDVDQAQDIARQYGIEAMPTTIIFEGGKEVRRFLGVQSEAALKQALGA